MSKPAIEFHNLSKLYQLGAIGYSTLRESLNEWWGNVRGRPSLSPSTVAIPAEQLGPRANTFWALRDLTATIERGEIVGVIGRNGAGKSTLLKILARITEPTSGHAIVRGRVGSLLEVGAGFHPELSGRDNIFLNGAILGMKKADIRRQLEAIIDFAEIGVFIDTPVKRYSSGMYVRLAFAIAAHLEPDILVLDEVLAVGDARFQKKCLGKVRDVSASHGRTVIFVSHDLQAVQRLCNRCMLLERGRLAEYNATRAVVARYSGAVGVARPAQWVDLTQVPREGAGAVRFTAMRLTSLNAEVGNLPYANGPLEIELSVAADAPTQVQSIAIGIRDDLGRRLVSADIGSFGQTISLSAGQSFIRIRIERLHLKAGNYSVVLWAARYAGEAISSRDIFDHIERACEIEVVELVGNTTRTSLGKVGLVTCDFSLLGVATEPRGEGALP